MIGPLATRSSELGRSFDSIPIGPGAQVHVLPTTKFKTVLFELFVRRDLEAERATELALLPLLLRRGTRAHPDLRAITRVLEALFGATLHTDIVKLGENQIIELRLELANPKYLGPERASILEDGASFLLDLLLDPALAGGGGGDAAGDGASGATPAFRSECLEQEKRTLRRYIEGLLNEKGAYATERCVQEMCRGEPFGIYEYGRVEDLPAIRPDAIYSFYRDLVATSPIDIFVAGDLPPERAAGLFAPRIGALARRVGRIPTIATPHPPREAAVREVVEERHVQQAKLVLGLRSEITYRDPEFPALLVANAVLGAYPHSKLFQVVREREGLCYYASSSLEKTKGVIVISSGIDASNYERARGLIEAQVDAIRAGEISTDELENTRRALTRSLVTIEDAPARKAHYFYGMLVNGRRASLADEIAALEAVRKEDVAAAARRVWIDTVYLLRDASGKREPAPAPAAAAGVGAGAGADAGTGTGEGEGRA